MRTRLRAHCVDETKRNLEFGEPRLYAVRLGLRNVPLSVLTTELSPVRDGHSHVRHKTPDFPSLCVPSLLASADTRLVLSRVSCHVVPMWNCVEPGLRCHVVMRSDVTSVWTASCPLWSVVHVRSEMVSHPQLHPQGTSVLWVLTKTHVCFMMPEVTSSHSASSCWCVCLVCCCGCCGPDLWTLQQRG